MNLFFLEKIYFDNCDLDDNDVASICENLGILNYLSLRNNNITDLNNITSEYNIGHSTLDVSGNKNIDLDIELYNPLKELMAKKQEEENKKNFKDK